MFCFFIYRPRGYTRPRGLYRFYILTPGVHMPRRDPFLKNQYYHIYNRWLKKSKLFFAFRDFQRFLFYIWEQMEKYKDSIWIIAYCVLPNHFHFVILNKQEWLNLSKFISKITSSYAKYIWAKYGLQWWKKLFESRFKAKLIDDKEYLDQCIHYVEFIFNRQSRNFGMDEWVIPTTYRNFKFERREEIKDF